MQLQCGLKIATDFCTTIEILWNRTKSDRLSRHERYRQAEIAYSYFFIFISAISYGHLKGFSEIMLAIDKLKEKVPGLRFHHGIKQRFYTFLYVTMPHLLVSLFYVRHMTTKTIRHYLLHRKAESM